MKHTTKSGWILLAGLAAAATALHAQTLPTGVSFIASSDHQTDRVTGYRVYILEGGSPLRTRDIGKPQPDGSGTITHVEPSLFTGLDAGSYEIAATAYGPGGESSPNRVPFSVSSTAPGTPSPPSNTQPIYDAAGAVALLVQAENFDNGGQGAAYRDLTAGNDGGAYRDTDVDIEPSGDTGAGHNVGWTEAGEWLQYTVNVPTAGTYALEVRVASLGPGGVFHIEIDGVDRTGPMTVPNTGGWQVWTTLRKSRVQLQAGTQRWRIVFDSHNPEHGYTGNFNWLRAAVQ